jgi:hypothetical protein
MPNLTISSPVANSTVPLGQPFLVTGQASDVGGAEPHLIDSVTVQLAGGPVIQATLTRIPNNKLTIVAFQAALTITGGGDPRVITVTATNDLGVSVRKTVTVFTGVHFDVAPPAFQIELAPAPIDPADPKNQATVNLLVSQIQQQLGPLSSLLASSGQTLAGPNLVLATNARGVPVLRLGLWVVGSTFPLLPPNPPNFPLPVLSDAAAAAGFKTLPFLPVPTPTGEQLLGFGAFIPTTTLQAIVNALFPSLAAAAAQNSVSLSSVTVTCVSPASVITSFVGQAGFPSATVTGTITEFLASLPVNGTNPLQFIPAVVSSSHTSGSNVFDQVLAGFLSPLFFFEALFITLATPAGVAAAAGQVSSIATSLVNSIPSNIPFRNTISPALPDFPVVVLDWGPRFGATNSGIIGLGTLTIQARTQAMVSLALAGPIAITGFQVDLAGGVDQTYSVAFPNLIPDSDKFTWAVSGSGSDNGSITANPLSQRGAFVATFPLPFTVKPGRFPFKLTVNATETSGTNAANTLTAKTSMKVTLNVLKNPKPLP